MKNLIGTAFALFLLSLSASGAEFTDIYGSWLAEDSMGKELRFSVDAKNFIVVDGGKPQNFIWDGFKKQIDGKVTPGEFIAVLGLEGQENTQAIRIEVISENMIQVEDLVFERVE